MALKLAADVVYRCGEYRPVCVPVIVLRQALSPSCCSSSSLNNAGHQFLRLLQHLTFQIKRPSLSVTLIPGLAGLCCGNQLGILW